MLLSLVDMVRCPAPHEESVLVLSADSWRDQRVWSGTLGCPLCHARHEIRDGTVRFGSPDVAPAGDSGAADAFRLAAQLGLMDPGGVILLTGRYARAHRELIETADVTCILLDAEPTGVHRAVNFSGVRRLPLADGSLRGAAVDHERANATFVEDVSRCVRAAGRVVVPARAPIPEGMRVVANDDTECVAEVVRHATRITLARAKPQ